MYNFDLHLPETITYRKHRYPNKLLKSISIQKNQITSDTRCITDESPTNLQPLLCGSITERQIIQKYRPTIIHRQIQSDNIYPLQLRKSILPLIGQSFTDRQSVEPRNNTPQQQQNNDRLSIKKLNALLGKKKLEPEKLRQDYPHLPEMQDFTKRMEHIYKKNNVNPLKLKSPIQEQIIRSPQQIDVLINLLKKRN